MKQWRVILFHNILFNTLNTKTIIKPEFLLPIIPHASYPEGHNLSSWMVVVTHWELDLKEERDKFSESMYIFYIFLQKNDRSAK